jgi:hypothetical protein
MALDASYTFMRKSRIIVYLIKPKDSLNTARGNTIS